MEPPLSQEDIPPPKKRESGLVAELQYFSPVEGCFKNLLKEPIKILSAFIWPLGETIQRCTWQYTFVTHLAVLFIPLLLRLQSQEAPPSAPFPPACPPFTQALPACWGLASTTEPILCLASSAFSTKIVGRCWEGKQIQPLLPAN